MNDHTYISICIYIIRHLSEKKGGLAVMNGKMFVGIGQQSEAIVSAHHPGMGPR
jgi:hypothetical protein